MEDPRWLRLITIGLILAALAVGYFLFTGKFSSNSAKTQSPQATVLGQTTKTQNGTTNASPNPTTSPSPTPTSAYNRIVSRNQNQVQTLPATGFPAGLAIALSVSAMIAGYGLRRFPR